MLATGSHTGFAEVVKGSEMTQLEHSIIYLGYGIQVYRIKQEG
jgi:hypothetical protein